MRKYAVIFWKSVKSEMIYRSAAVFSALSGALSFVIQIFLWRALLGAGQHNGVGFSDMLLFVLINTFVQSLMRVSLADKIEETIIDGTVGMEIIRPYSYKLYWLSSIAGKNFYKALTGFVPAAVIAAFLISPDALPGLANVLLFVPSIVLGVLITFEINYIFGLLAFWIQRCWFLRWYLIGFTKIFGGTVVPLWFYPAALAKISGFLPFQYMSFMPINIFLGKISGLEAGQALLVAALWLLGLGLLSSVMWRSAVRRLSVNGG